MSEMSKARAIVRTGATALLTLTLTVGSVPLNGFAAYAQEVSTNQATKAATQPGGFALKQGWGYAVPVALQKDDGTPSMAVDFFEKEGTVTWDGSKYTVVFTVKETGRNFIKSISGADALSDGKYSVNVSDLTKAIALKFDLQVPGAGAMTQTGYLHLTTDSLPKAEAVDITKLAAEITAASNIKQGNKTDDAWNALQTAIKNAQNAMNSATSQAEADKALADLKTAVSTFNASADKPATPAPTYPEFIKADGYETGFKLYYKGADATSQFGRSFKDTVKVVEHNGAYYVELTAKSLGKAGTLSDVTVGGKAVAYVDNTDGSRTYQIPVSSLTGKNDFTFSYVITAMNRKNTHDFQIELASYQSAYQVYYKGSDASAQYVGKSFQDKVKVAPQADGSYLVELTANSLGNAGKLADVKVDGRAVKYTDNKDGSRTYQIPMKDLKATLDFTFGYTVSFNGQSRTMEHPFQLVLAGAEYAGPTATVEFLNEQIAKAEAALEKGEKKPQSAKDALQKEIDAAKKVAANDKATAGERGKAMKAVVDATATFQATADVSAWKPAAGLEIGKTYTVPVKFYNESNPSEESMAGKMIESNATVKVNDGSYEVTLVVKKGDGFEFKSLTFGANDEAASMTTDADGNYVFTGKLDDISGSVRVGFKYHIDSMNVDHFQHAIAKFDTSKAQEVSGTGKPNPDTKLEVGKEYTVNVQLQKQDGTASMAADYFEKTATVVYDGTSYKVTFTVTKEGVQYIKSIAGVDATVEDLGNGVYAVTVSSLDNRIALKFGLSTPVGEMTQTGYLWIDTASLGLKPQTKPEENNNPKDDNNNPKDDNNTPAKQAFEVGHTYQVPITFKKTGTSETSMAAQYFGDTALVRPQADGTFKVSFTTNKPEWITALTFKGATITASNGQYTITVPAATADQVYQLGLTIKPMGDKSVTTDLHLYLSQAKDLGTGKDNLTASSQKVLPQTGDNSTVAIAAAAGLGVAALAGAEVLRRRSNRA